MKKIILIACLSFFPSVHADDGIPEHSLNLLRSLVEINSGTENEAGLERVRGILVPEFEKLGFRSQVTQGCPGHKFMVFDTPNSQPKLLLVGHIDTVFPVSSAFQKLSAEADRLHGPGVIDMKGGIVLMLDALAALKDKDLLGKIRIVINDDEETGSPCSTELMNTAARGIPYALIFEPGQPDGAFVTGHSGLHWVELAVHGKAAHAGLEPQKGVNACVELAQKIARLAKLTDYSKRLTVNPDVIQGGTKTNIVCDHASAKIDIRYGREQDLPVIKKKLEEITKESFVKNPAGQGTTAEIKELTVLPGVTERSTGVLFKKAQAIGKKLKIPVKGEGVGYGSNANNLAMIGMQVLIGLGPYGGGMHTEQEMMELRSYPERLRIDTALIEEILK